MIRIGIVDLDTSHSSYYTACINRLDDLRVTAVWDGGAVRPAGYMQDFAREHGIAQICTTLAEMAPLVDAAMLLGQNWDLHLERARPFLEAGKPVYVDKPIVGRWRDAVALLDLAARTGTPIMGGSSLRYARELVELREQLPQLGPIISAFASGPGDFLNYGTHIVDMVGGFFGPGAEAVSYIGGGSSHLMLLERHGGPPVILQFSGGLNHHDNACYLSITTERGIRAIQPQAGWGISEILVGKFAQFVRTGIPATPFADSLETVKVILAAAEARHTGRRIPLDAIPIDASFDGAAFTADYARGGGYEGTGLSARSRYSSQS